MVGRERWFVRKDGDATQTRGDQGALTEQRIGERLKLEGETENMGVCTKERDVG